MKIHDRYYWALDKLALKDDDHVLEIGFGAGILLDLMANHPANVLLTGIDKSNPARYRNRLDQIVKSTGGRVQIVHDGLLNISLPRHTYSKIVAFNVPFFREETSPEFGPLKSALAHGGKLFVFYQNPITMHERDVRKIARTLEANDFSIVESGLAPKKINSLYVVAETSIG